MKRMWGLAILTFVTLACGEEPQKEPSPCKGEECGSCEPETDAELCAARGAVCGTLEVSDRCGESRMVSCGGCAVGKVCRDHQCVDERTPGSESGCLLVPRKGVCRDLVTVETCVGEEGEEEVVVQACATGEICVDEEEGARCKPLGESCDLPIAYCTEEGNVRKCVDGEFRETPCEHGCSHDLRWGPVCRTMKAGTKLQRGEVRYEHRVPNETKTGWGEPEYRPAAGLFVFSLDAVQQIDTTVVADDGTFEILVPDPPSAEARLVFLALEKLMGSEDLVVSVADPVLPPGRYDPGQVGDEAIYWSWAIEVPEDGDTVVLTEAVGSAAIQVFQAMRQTMRHVAVHKGLDMPSFTGWYGEGVEWSCGACFMRPTEGTGAHVVFSSGQFDYAYNDSVLFHETGHYAFHALGPEHWEGGGHCAGVPAPPSQALNEGFASWYSADRRKDPQLFDTSWGMFAYWDIDKMSPQRIFAPPVPSEGEHQPTNETWVAAIAWRLANEVRTSRPIFEALYAPEMRPPFRSGYTGKIWWSIDEHCRPVNPQDTGLPSPLLADLLDAMVCGGYPETPIRTYVSPHLPYDPTEAICR